MPEQTGHRAAPQQQLDNKLQVSHILSSLRTRPPYSSSTNANATLLGSP